VSVGVGAAGLALDRGVIVAAILALVLAAGLWWAYFDKVMHYAERDLAAATGAARAQIARDGYSSLNLPIVAGIVFLALGLKKSLDHVGDPLDTIPAVALCGGVALFLVAHNSVRFRLIRSVSVPRMVVALVACLLVPVATSVAALTVLAILTALVAMLAVFETVTAAATRREVRSHHAV